MTCSQQLTFLADNDQIRTILVTSPASDSNLMRTRIEDKDTAHVERKRTTLTDGQSL